MQYAVGESQVMDTRPKARPRPRLEPDPGDPDDQDDQDHLDLISGRCYYLRVYSINRRGGKGDSNSKHIYN